MPLLIPTQRVLKTSGEHCLIQKIVKSKNRGPAFARSGKILSHVKWANNVRRNNFRRKKTRLEPKGKYTRHQCFLYHSKQWHRTEMPRKRQENFNILQFIISTTYRALSILFFKPPSSNMSPNQRAFYLTIFVQMLFIETVKTTTESHNTKTP